jgi:hypothetical protein
LLANDVTLAAICSENIWIGHWGKYFEPLTAEILKSLEDRNESDIKDLCLIPLSRILLEKLITAQLARNSNNFMEAEGRNYFLTPFLIIICPLSARCSPQLILFNQRKRTVITEEQIKKQVSIMPT